MTWAFSNWPTPSWYRRAEWKTAQSKRNGVHYVGEPVKITLASPLAADATYAVRDYFGEILSSGSVSTGQSSFIPAVPAGGWKPGWYRVYLTGPQTDANFAYSCGATNFCVVRNDPHFVRMPGGNVPVGKDFFQDHVMAGVMGVGTARLSIKDVANLSAWPSLADLEHDLGVQNTYWVNDSDPSRPRHAWCQVPGFGYDVALWDDHLGRRVGYFFCKDGTVDGSKVSVQVTAGTNPQTVKVIVCYPATATVAETFDNIPHPGQGAGGYNDFFKVESAVNGQSAHIIFLAEGFSDSLDPMPETIIGRDHFNGVKTVVETLFPLGCTHFEGPQNEPRIDKAYTVHMMRLFQAAVHAGHSDAKAIGPCPVDTGSLGAFFALGGHNYCDEISFHAYNAQTNGDINLGRSSLQSLADTLESHGVSEVPLWQTESTCVMTSVYGVYHPRRARVPLLQTLLMEQFGIPRECNNYWYHVSAGFWDFPVWLENGDGSLNPQAVLYRVLAEETWGKPFASALDFGTPGNAMYLGNVYTGDDGKSTVVLMAASYMKGASVVLTIAGVSGPLKVVGGLGQTNTKQLSNGRITLSLTDVPKYVRLPAGASASVYRVNGHSPIGVSKAPSATSKKIDGVNYPAIADDAYMTRYDSVGIAPTTWATPPSVSEILWPQPQTFSRVIVWAGPCWQNSGTLIDFSVETSDGATWTPRKRVTKPAPGYFEFGTDSSNAGCLTETYWDEQWIFDVKIPTVTATGLRVRVHSASYGGEPLAASGFGQGSSNQAYRIQEIGAYEEAA